MEVTRRDLIRKAGAAGVGLTGAGLHARTRGRRRAAAQEQVKLNLWKAPHSFGDDQFWRDKLAEFTAANPTIEVAYRMTLWDTWDQTYTAAFAGDSPPDVSYIIDSFYPKHADAGDLVDLATLPGADLTAWEPLFDPTVWAKSVRNGKTCGLPFLQVGTSFIWNKTLFRDAGLDPETPPATWEELREMAKALTKPDGSQWGFAFMDDSTAEMSNFVTVPIVNHGGDLSNADDSEWVANSEGHVQGLQILVDLIHHDKTAPPFGTFIGPAVDSAFLAGKIAMWLSQPQFLASLSGGVPNFEIGIGAPPAGPANNQSVGGIGYWMMAEKSRHKDEAWALMEFLTSSPVMTDYAKLTGLFQTRLDVNPFADQPLMEAFAKTQRNFTRLPAFSFAFWPPFMSACTAALTREVSAREALNNAARQINDLIKQG